MLSLLLKQEWMFVIRVMWKFFCQNSINESSCQCSKWKTCQVLWQPNIQILPGCRGSLFSLSSEPVKCIQHFLKPLSTLYLLFSKVKNNFFSLTFWNSNFPCIITPKLRPPQIFCFVFISDDMPLLKLYHTDYCWHTLLEQYLF